MQSAHDDCGGIIQVHATTRCNLACAHCYSHSSPSATAVLAADLVCRTIEEAAQLGFRIVSLSGGEPLVYDGLDDIVATVKRCGSRVNLVSNGILIRSSRYERHAGSFSVVALSLDGLAERHNAIRGSEKSFDQVKAAAATLRGHGQAFGLIHTLCSESLDEIEEIAGLASDWGARLFQLHPFEPSGRDLGAVKMTPLSAEERLDAFLLAEMLQEQFPNMRIQLDLIHREVARRVPAAIHGAPLNEPMVPRELVLEETGQLVPLSYGLDRAFAVTDIRSASLDSSWSHYLETGWPAFRRQLRRACVAVARGKYGEVAAWHEVVREYAAAPSAPPVPLRFERLAA